MTDKYTPSKGDYIDLKGKKYLPARRRVQWFRGEHPDWGIATTIVDLDFGAGYAVIRAEVTDETGRLIASGMKSETRSGFADFVEKAETGAIARAVAIAGFGTEDALDLDEGERIADSPVAARTQPESNGSRPGGATPNRARSASVQYRRGELLDLMESHGLDIAAVDAIADRIGIPKKERPMSDESMDRLIAAIETPEPARAHAEDPAGEAVARAASPSDLLESAAAITGGTLEPPRPGTESYRALPAQQKVEARAWWQAHPEPEEVPA